MHVISKRALVDFWLTHKEAETPLSIWYAVCKRTNFGNFAQLKSAFRSVDKVGKFTVFDIGGNKWRLIAIVNYSTRKIYVRGVLTHDEYDRNFWKRE
jgi:mRNA interferase HigB